MPWGEFSTLLAQLNYKTPLGEMVSIRSETDKEKLKNFTPEMKRARRDWHVRMFKDQAEENKRMTADFQAAMKAAFLR